MLRKLRNESVYNFTRGVGGIVKFRLNKLFLVIYVPSVIFASFDHAREEKVLKLPVAKLQTKPGILITMKKLCTQCFYIGEEASSSYGNFKTEFTLWGLAFFFALLGAFYTDLWFPASIIFFIALFYTITRYKIKSCVCPKCESNSMIPLASPKAIQLIGEHNIVSPYDIPQTRRAILGVSFRNILLILSTALIALTLYKHFS